MTFTIDKEFEIPVYSPVCCRCAHLVLNKDATWSCAAYPEPDSIPMPIWKGENDHQAPYAGDHGVRFKPRPQRK